jgi:hypothetical protein
LLPLPLDLVLDHHVTRSPLGQDTPFTSTHHRHHPRRSIERPTIFLTPISQF